MLVTPAFDQGAMGRSTEGGCQGAGRAESVRRCRALQVRAPLPADGARALVQQLAAGAPAVQD